MIDTKFKKIYDEFIEKYKEIHVNPFHNISEDELNKIYNDLIENMDVKNGTSFNYFINYIIKRLSGNEDAHTSYQRFWPVSLNFRMFDNEILINYPEYLKGSRLLSINSIKIDKIINELEEIITYGTIGGRKYKIENALCNKLYLLGLPSLRKNREKLIYEIELLDGSIIKKEFISNDVYKDMFDYEKYLYGDIVSYKFIDDILIYKCTSLQNQYKEKIKQVINNLKNEDLSNINTIVVDIRGNLGGISKLTKSLIEFLKEHNDKKLICLTDYRVFSAGRYLLRDLINLGAVTIGEEIGTPINCYGESHHIVMDDNYNFSISEKYFNPLINLEITTKEEYEEKINKDMLVPVIYKPDILINETKEDFISGKDTILEYAVNYSKGVEYDKRK